VTGRLKGTVRLKFLSFLLRNTEKVRENLLWLFTRPLRRVKKLYVKAPTGIGKTISTLFPAVKAIGEDMPQKFLPYGKDRYRRCRQRSFCKNEAKGTFI